MYWSRVKTILIFLFLALDIFLLGYIIHSGHDEYAVTLEERENTVAVLEKNNLKINPDLIPDRTTALGIVEMNSLWTDLDGLASMVLGAGKEKISDTIYQNDDNRFEIFDDGFSYTTNLKNISKPSLKTAEEKLRKFNIYVDEKDGRLHGNEIIYTQEIDDNPIFETEISVKTSSGKIAEIDGYWIFSVPDGSDVKREEYVLYSVCSVLINFTENDLYDKTGDEITNIEKGYSIGSPVPDTRHKLVSVAPAYKITLKNGSYAVYDSINGELLYNVRNE